MLDAGADVNISDVNGNTPLMVVAESEREDFPCRLIAAGANLNAKNAEGRTALMIAADFGNSAMARVLIQAGADLNATDNNGISALIYAEKDDLTSIQEVSEQADKDDVFCKSQRFNDGIGRRQVTRRQRIARYLRDAGASEQGLSGLVLVKAAANGDIEEINVLIDAGANVNAISPQKGTALMQALSKAHIDIVRMLLASGANPNLKVCGDPPLIQAAENGQIELVHLLLEAGADPHITDSYHEGWEGYTAVDHAQRQGHSEIVKLLRQFGGDRQREIPVSEWRGLVSDDLNDTMILVQSPVELVAAALCQIKGATIWQKNVFEQEVELTDLCFVVFQFIDHAWSIVHVENTCSWSDFLQRGDAIALSHHLQVKAIYYGVSDTAGAIQYELIDAGESIELFDFCCDSDFIDEIENGGEPNTIYGRSFKFQSSLRQINIGDVHQSFDFVDAFFKSQDAFVPAWGRSSHHCGIGKRRNLGATGIEPSELRMDYVAVSSIDFS